MKRAGMILAVLLCATAALAQVRGVPPSVTSVTPSRGVTGVPASVGSLGPHGFRGTAQFGAPFGTAPLLPPTTFTCSAGGLVCAPTTTPPVNIGRRRHHPVAYPYYYPYPVYPTYPVIYSDMYPPQPEAEAEPIEEEPPAPTIFERRPRTRPYARDEQRYDTLGEERPAQPAQPVMAVQEQEPTTLIFRDGHQFEVHNYAIVGATLFNFDGTGPFKVQLAELDVAATEKLNGDRGVDFKIPR